MKTRITMKQIITVMVIGVALILLAVKVRGQTPETTEPSIFSGDGAVIDCAKMPALCSSGTSMFVTMPTSIRATYEPQEDITAYELAQLLPYLLGKHLDEKAWEELGIANRHLKRTDDKAKNAHTPKPEPDRLFSDDSFGDWASRVCANGWRTREQGIKYHCPVVESEMLPEAFAPKYAHARQDKSTAIIPIPAAVKLSPEATKELIVLAQQKAVLAKQYAEIEDKERLLMIGAQVPEAARRNCTIPAGETQVICTVPAPVVTEKKETP